MGNIWNGPESVNGPLDDNYALGYDKGYRAAMNSPEVTDMYQELKQMKAHGHSGGCSSCNPRLAMRSYENGLREIADGS